MTNPMEVVNRIILHVDGHFISILYRSKSYNNKNEEEMRKKYWEKLYQDNGIIRVAKK